jgi:hypothetical protein
MTASVPIKAKHSSARWRIRFRSLILAAAILQMGVTGAVFAVGRSGLLPSQFDRNGLGTFASDSIGYQTEAVQLCDVLRTQGIAAWANWPTQLHVRLYSLPLAALRPSSGFNILKIEPLNLIYYLGILTLVFKLGQIVFGHRAALLATAAVAVWPSFLLHTTQLLRDPLLIVAFLMLILSLIQCLKRDYRWHRGVLWGLAGATAILVIRIVRLPMWDLLWAVIGLAVCLLVTKAIQQRSMPIGKVVFMALMIATMLIVPHFQAAFRAQQKVKIRRVLLPEELQQLSVPDQIARRREGFGLRMTEDGGVGPSEAGSDLNEGTHFSSMLDIVRYLPRAIEIGFFAPFPNMWFRPGKQVGSAGRLLSGIESMLTYLIEGFALAGLWSAKRQPAVWLLALAASMGIVVLGLIVSNVGALVRLRYPFWILMVIIGAAGAFHLIAMVKRRRGYSTGVAH